MGAEYRTPPLALCKGVPPKRAKRSMATRIYRRVTLENVTFVDVRQHLSEQGDFKSSDSVYVILRSAATKNPF